MMNEKNKKVFSVRYKIIYGLIVFIVILFITFFIYLTTNKKSTNLDPEFNTPELYASPGTENYSSILNLDKLIEAGFPEDIVLNLKNLIYDYQRKKDEHIIDVDSISNVFEELSQQDFDSNKYKKFIFKFKAFSKADNKYYFYRIIQIDNSDFTFEIFSDNNFNNSLYFYSSSEYGDY